MYILILSLFFALLVAIFAVQNSSPVPIHILWTTQEIPLVLVILGSALAGAFIVFLLALWREFRYRRRKAQEAKSSSPTTSSANRHDQPNKSRKSEATEQENGAKISKDQGQNDTGQGQNENLETKSQK